MRKISKETGLSPDYAFLVVKDLLKQKLIKKIANDVFILTSSGRLLLGRLRDSLERKTPTLIKVFRSFDTEVEPPPFEPEIHFISRELMSEQPYITEHNLGKGQITEMANAHSIQKSIKRLTTANPVRNKLSKDTTQHAVGISNGAKGRNIN